MSQSLPFEVEGKFSFEPPASWTVVEAKVYTETLRKNLNLMPAGPARDAAEKSKPPLAVFVGPAMPLFQSNLNIRQLEGAPRLDEKGVEEYRQNAVQAFGPLQATIERAELITVDGKPALRGEFNYHLAGQGVRSTQAIFGGRQHTYIVTYTTLSSRYPAEQPAIEVSIASFRLKEPWHTVFGANPIFFYALIAAVAGGILAALFRRRNARLNARSK